MILGIPFVAHGSGKSTNVNNATSAILSHICASISERGRLANPKTELLNTRGISSDAVQDFITQRVMTLEDRSVIIGNDHAVTYAAVSAFAKRNRDVGLILFDAHFNLKESSASTESMMHGNVLRQLIQDNIVSLQRVMIVGNRIWNLDEYRMVKNAKIINYPMHEIASEGIHSTCDAVMAAVREWSAVFFCVNMNVLDPAFAPGVRHAEPAGMSTRELLYFIHRLLLLRNIKMGAVVGVDSEKDVCELTVRGAAKIAMELYALLN